MAGCSIVFLTILMLPALTIIMVLSVIAYAASAWVTGPAFPFFVIGALCDVVACVLVARLAWRRFHDHEEIPLEPRTFAAPLALCCVGLLAYLVMTVLTGGQFLDFIRTLDESAQG